MPASRGKARIVVGDRCVWRFRFGFGRQAFACTAASNDRPLAKEAREWKLRKPLSEISQHARALTLHVAHH